MPDPHHRLRHADAGLRISAGAALLHG